MSLFEIGVVIALVALAAWCALLQVQIHQQRRDQRATKEFAAQAKAEASNAKLAAMEAARTTGSGPSASAQGASAMPKDPNATCQMPRPDLVAQTTPRPGGVNAAPAPRGPARTAVTPPPPDPGGMRLLERPGVRDFQRSFPNLPLAQDDRPSGERASGDGAVSKERPTTLEPSHVTPEADPEMPTDPDRSSDVETALIIRDDVDRAFAAARAGDLEQLGPQQVVEPLGQRTG